MDAVRKTDPTFTNYVPKTAAEAVDRYVRCRNNGLRPMLVPECLIACARGLKGKELDMFESWVINPQGDLDDVKLVETKSIREANDKIFEENLARITSQGLAFGSELPPLPADVRREVPSLERLQDEKEEKEAPEDALLPSTR